MNQDTPSKTYSRFAADELLARRGTRRAKLVGLVILGAFVLAACTSAVADQSNPGGASDTALPADFTITAYQGEEILGGEEVNLSDLLKQGKPIVLNFWAGLCPPCWLEMPDLQAVHNAYQDRILLFGLDVGPFTALGTNDDGRQLREALGVTYPTGTTSDAQVVQANKSRACLAPTLSNLMVRLPESGRAC